MAKRARGATTAAKTPGQRRKGTTAADPAASNAYSKRGRPTDFKPEYAEQVERLCKLKIGATDEDIAEFFDKAVSTISLWKRKHPEFSEALARGKTLADMAVADSLFRRANGFEWDEDQAIKVKEVIYGENGKRLKETERVEIVRVHRVVPADTNACMAWLSNRQKWRHKVDHEHTGKGGGPIILYADDEGL
jgi:hypothetical protein